MCACSWEIPRRARWWRCVDVSRRNRRDHGEASAPAAVKARLDGVGAGSDLDRAEHQGVILVDEFLTKSGAMKSLAKRIMEYAEASPEATPICPNALLHLGKRGAVNQALSRLARSGQLLRICQGVYMRPVETRFGRCAPSVGKSLRSLSELWGETIVPNGGGAANWLGLTNQNPVRSVYLTSGRGRRLLFGKHPVELRHAPRWQLVAPHRMAGVVIRALAWLGPHEIEDSLDTVLPRLTREDLDELATARAVMPRWMAEPLSTRLAHA